VSNAYWQEYSNLQKVKHDIIKNYLQGWFPKMSLGPYGQSRLLYIDTHAGRGTHLSGKLGSPLVALESLLTHASRDSMLAGAEVRYFFIERDDANVQQLKAELATVSLPTKVYVTPITGDFEKQFDKLLDDIDTNNMELAPSFIFIDPFGFKLPGRILKRLLNYPKVELFINVIWRELDMAIRVAQKGTAKGMDKTLDQIFLGDSWRAIEGDDADARAAQCAAIYPEMTGAKWGTHIWMLDNNRVRYFLIHLSNHDAGRDLMKDCIWKSCPDGGYYASKADNPQQQLLIQPTPDLQPLREWIFEQLADGPQRWSVLTDRLRAELWLNKHLNSTLKDLRRANRLTGEAHTGQFAATNDPLIRLAPRIKGRGLPPG